MHIHEPHGAEYEMLYALDCPKIKDLGWQPEGDLDEGLSRTDWHWESQGWVEGVATGEHRGIITEYIAMIKLNISSRGRILWI